MNDITLLPSLSTLFNSCSLGSTQTSENPYVARLMLGDEQDKKEYFLPHSMTYLATHRLQQKCMGVGHINLCDFYFFNSSLKCCSLKPQTSFIHPK